MSIADDQIAFLEQLADEVLPIVYYDPAGERHRVIIQRLVQTAPYKHGARLEPVIQINMIDAWAGIEVQDISTAKVQTSWEIFLQ